MKLVFTGKAWDQFVAWQESDLVVARRVSALITDALRHPFTGLGKPEPLKNDLRGFWSRRITQEHRLVYRVAGKGDDQALEVAQCRFHY